MVSVISIICPNQSGSTILAYLLGSHPEIATTGEVRVSLNNARCSCGSEYATCSFWQRVSQEMRGLGFGFDIRGSDLEFTSCENRLSDLLLGTAVRGPILEIARDAGLVVIPHARSELRRLLQRNEAFIEVVTRLKSCTTFLDSTKHLSRAIHLRRCPKLKVRVIHLIRDGRATAWSAMRHGDCSPSQAASHWMAKHLEAERARRYFQSDQWIDIRYEDLCAKPEETLGKLHDFIGVENLPIPQDFRSGQHILGNSRTRSSSSNSIRCDDRWKSDLTENELQKIECILGKVNQEYGYAPIMPLQD